MNCGKKSKNNRTEPESRMDRYPLGGMRSTFYKSWKLYAVDSYKEKNYHKRR